MVCPEWQYAAAGEQLLSDESQGCSRMQARLNLAKAKVLKRR
jgi:hypothetical protein